MFLYPTRLFLGGVQKGFSFLVNYTMRGLLHCNKRAAAGTRLLHRGGVYDHLAILLNKLIINNWGYYRYYCDFCSLFERFSDFCLINISNFRGIAIDMHAFHDNGT